MADDKGKQPIIIKKIEGGHGGAHGGAWKVAYADFVTAMMCFFLVMWLMGADEETKQAVAHYFNHPQSPWQDGRDPDSEAVQPMGEDVGAGQSIMNGLDGGLPEDLIDRPVRPPHQRLKKNRAIIEKIEEVLEGEAYGIDVNPNYIRFSMPEQILFEPGSTRLSARSRNNLAKLARLFADFDGYIKVIGHTDSQTQRQGRHKNPWEISLSRAVTVMNYLIKVHGVRANKFEPVAMADRKPLTRNRTPAAQRKNNRVEFSMSVRKPR